MSLIEHAIDHLQDGESITINVQRRGNEATVVIQPRRKGERDEDLSRDSADSRIVAALDRPLKLTLPLDGNAIADGSAMSNAIDGALQPILAERAVSRDALARYRESHSEARKHAQASEQQEASGVKQGEQGQATSDNDGGQQAEPVPADSNPDSLV